MPDMTETFNLEKKILTGPKKDTSSQNLLKARDYCTRAEELLQKKQWPSAQKILEKGILEVEKTAQAYHLLGLALYHQGFFGASINKFQKACEMEKNPEYLLNLSLALNEIGRYEEGKKAYEKALHIQTQFQEQNWKEEVAEKHQQTAQIYLKKNQFKLALEEYIKGSQFHQTPQVQLAIAELLWKVSQKETAEKYLTNFLSLYPHNIKARLMLANWHFENKQIAQAVNEWESILKIQPENKEAHNCLQKVQQLSEWS